MTIANLEIKGDDTATAFGEKYDLEKVLDAAEAFMRSFAAHVLFASPGARATVRLDGDEIRFDDDGMARLRGFYRRLALRHDLVWTGASVFIGPFRLTLRLLGDDDLFLKEGDTEPSTIDGSRWDTIETTPSILVVPVGGSSPLFETAASDTVHALVRSHAPPGVDAAGTSGIPSIRFPHAAFGAGHGALRIALNRISDDTEDPVMP